MDPKTLASFLDLANHHANTTFGEIEDICNKVIKYGFNAVFVNPYFVPFARGKMGAARIGTSKAVEIITPAPVPHRMVRDGAGFRPEGRPHVIKAFSPQTLQC